MNTIKFIKIGNLFEFAEKRLQELVKREDLYSYSLMDIINMAVKVRKYLDKHPKGLKIPTQTPEERKYLSNKRKKINYKRKDY